MGCLLLPFWALPACRGSGQGNGITGSAASAQPVGSQPPPLDTSWQKDATRQLAAGDTAPDFEGIAHTDMRVRLSSFLDKPVVVAFYDADGSAQALDLVHELRDHWLEMTDRVSMVFGISADDRVTHRDFATAERLPFLLVADDTGRIGRAFGVPFENGRPRAMTFVVGKDRKILRVIQGSAPGTHVPEILASVP